MENLQREDLNPVEETEAVLELLAMTLEVDKNEVVSILHQSYNAKQRGLQLNQNVLIQLEKIESLLSEIGRFNAGTFRSSRLPLLNLPDEVLSALRRGAIEYTKAAVIARVKEPSLRESLLEEAIADSLSLSEIKERVKAAVEPPTEPPALVKRMETIYKLTKKQKLWDDPKKRRKLETLLAKIEELISFDGLDESPPKEEVEATQDEPPLTSDSLQDSSPLESEKDPLESREDVTVAISSESSLPPPEMAEKPFDPETPSSELSDKSKPLAKEEPTSGSREVTESLTDAEMASRLGVKTSTLGKAKKRTDFSEWSQSKDPQAIAWQWVTESKHFVPLKN
jgi:ParB-like chromosome segregation protein Spo0J